MNITEHPTWRGRPVPLSRRAIEDEIERLIDLLDAADDDPDLEDGADDEDGGDTEPNGDEGDHNPGSEDGI